MKLPEYAYRESARVNVPTPGVANLAELSPQMAQQAGLGLRELGQTIEKISDAMQAAEEKKRLIRNKIEVANIRAGVEVQMKNLLTTLEETEANDEALTAKFHAGSLDIQNEALRKASSEEARNALLEALPHTAAEYTVRAKSAADRKYVSNQIGTTENTIHRRLTLARSIGFNEWEWAAWQKEKALAVDAASDLLPVEGKERVEARIRKINDDFYSDRASHHIEQDHLGFLGEAQFGKLYKDMDQEKRMTYIRAAEARKHSAQQEYEQSVKVSTEKAKQELHEAELASKQLKEDTRTNLKGKVMSGQSINADLQDPTVRRILGPEGIDDVLAFPEKWETHLMNQGDDPQTVVQWNRFIDEPNSTVTLNQVTDLLGVSARTKISMQDKIQRIREAALTRQGTQYLEEYRQGLASIRTALDRDAVLRPRDQKEIAALESRIIGQYEEASLPRRLPDGSLQVKEPALESSRRLKDQVEAYVRSRQEVTAESIVNQLPSRYRPPAGKVLLRGDILQGRITDMNQAETYGRLLEEYERLKAAETKTGGGLQPPKPTR